MTRITRRNFAALAGALALAPVSRSLAADQPKEFVIGYQKTGLLVIAREQATIEKRLEKLGVAVKWVEFASGPPLLEALNVGSVHFGYTGDTPPIFAQAAGANLVYVGAAPSNGAGEGVIVKPDSPIKSLADLKGKRIGFTKGSSSNNLTIAAVEKAGLKFSDITPIYLSPADAAAAFAGDQIDAWTIWDPFFAIAQQRYNPRVLVTSRDVLNVNTYLLANATYAAKYPSIVAAANDGLADAAQWAAQNRDKVAQSLAKVTGVDLAAQTVAANRADFGVLTLTPEIIARQQESADRFYRLGLIPRAIVVRDAVWTRPQA